MCGIAGIVAGEQKQGTAVLAAMSQSMRYRGPDDEGYLLVNKAQGGMHSIGGVDTDSSLNLPDLHDLDDFAWDLALVHRRLSILDLSSAGHGPMCTNDQKFWITYNGEIYNYVELREELRELGAQFLSDSDTEVILHAYRTWGEECLNRFNGMWAFALWDTDRDVLFCARDRFGIKPFYYWHSESEFVFASEIKTLLCHPEILPSANPAIVYDYLALGAVDHTDDTFFDGIQRLAPGTHLTLDLSRKKLATRKWWSLDVEQRSDRSVSAEEAFLRYFTDSIRLRLRSDVSVGTCLSGGLDSSSIVMVLSKLRDTLGVDERIGQFAFTACYDDSEVDERQFACAVLEASGVKGKRVFPLEKDFWADLPQLVTQQQQPFVSTSIYAQWRVMQLAKESSITVLLDGQGGDEVLAGYRNYHGPFLRDVLLAGRLSDFAKHLALAPSRSSLDLRKVVFSMIFQALPLSLRRTINNTLIRRFRANPGFSRAGLRSSLRDEYRDRDLKHAKHLKIGGLHSRLRADLTKNNLPQLLRYEDINSMAHSIEARVPFLDHRLVEFLFSLPPHEKMQKGWSKWVLRNSTQGILPNAIRWRKSKLGFATPERKWLVGGSQMIQGVLGGQTARIDIFVDPAIRLQFARAVGEGRLPEGLWPLLNLELWLQQYDM